MSDSSGRYYFSQGADATTLSLLRQGVASWNRTRESPLCDNRPHLHAAPLLFANLGNADLRGLDLSGIDFSRISLHQAILDKASLAYSSLADSHIEQASLRGADLLSADLSIVYAYGTRFDGADLRWCRISGAFAGASFANADLRFATISGDFEGTDFRSAQFGATSLLQVTNLAQAEGLASVRHDAPSIVSRDVLRASWGALPRSFLRGCGLADWEIEAARLYDPYISESERTSIAYEVLRLQTRQPINVAPIFICYSHRDGAFVDCIAKALDDRGVRYWRDIHHATSGRIDEVIDRGLRLNDVLLVILSEASINSRWVEMELSYAIDRKLKLCPVALDSSWSSSSRLSADVVVQLEKHIILDFSQWENPERFAEQFRKLFEGLGIHYSSRAEVG
jgi:uncharacterized protein YjbI with pentapeptide repeats